MRRRSWQKAPTCYRLNRAEPYGYLYREVAHAGAPQRSTSVVERDIAAQVVTEVDLAGARDFLLGIEEHLLPLRDPAGSARNGEEHREHGHRKAHRLVNQPGVEVHVG